jgi:hypothetical protein
MIQGFQQLSTEVQKTITIPPVYFDLIKQKKFRNNLYTQLHHGVTTFQRDRTLALKTEDLGFKTN